MLGAGLTILVNERRGRGFAEDLTIIREETVQFFKVLYVKEEYPRPNMDGISFLQEHALIGNRFQRSRDK